MWLFPRVRLALYASLLGAAVSLSLGTEPARAQSPAEAGQFAAIRAVQAAGKGAVAACDYDAWIAARDGFRAQVTIWRRLTGRVTSWPSPPREIGDFPTYPIPCFPQSTTPPPAGPCADCKAIDEEIKRLEKLLEEIKSATSMGDYIKSEIRIQQKKRAECQKKCAPPPKPKHATDSSRRVKAPPPARTIPPATKRPPVYTPPPGRPDGTH